MAIWIGWFIYLPALALFEWLLHRYQPQTVWQISGLGGVATLALEVPVLLLSYPFFNSFFVDLLMLAVSGATYGFLHYSWISAEQYNS
ncbi:hypothetical protein MUN82_07860 [Hymenobacter aerilatus]|uniref:Uncharacterized protein n=1 Tax=Hymenobacter aerilatus TaxID=2932251 RepID=A0A8T9T208_9BACT|nr:hypothetical protein [Hymenobacter aerilatus]UOR07003.1 hypothetical protein MUN82_07860 [Hymenobacter aerilatus]